MEYHGKGDREAVCLLNGLAMHTKAWYGFLPMLTDENDVILYDFLGQGESSKDDVPYFIDVLARHLALIMDELGVEKVHPMGISYGGFIALEFARLYPERLHTLILSGSWPAAKSSSRCIRTFLCVSTVAPRASSSSTPTTCTKKIFSERFVKNIRTSSCGDAAAILRPLYRLSLLPDPAHGGAGPVLRQHRGKGRGLPKGHCGQR